MEQLLSTNGDLAVSLESSLQREDTAERLWQIIKNGFLNLNRQSILRQDATEREFMVEARDESVLKFVLWDTSYLDPLPIGYLPMHTQLDHLDWLNPVALSKNFSAYAKQGNFFYNGDLVIAPGERGLSAAMALTGQVARYLVERTDQSGLEPIIGVDYCQANATHLTRLIEMSFQQEGLDLGFHQLSRHNWYRADLAGGQNQVTRQGINACNLQLYNQRFARLDGLGERPIFFPETTERAQVIMAGLAPLILHQPDADADLISESYLSDRGINQPWRLDGFHSVYEASDQALLQAINQMKRVLPAEATLIFDADESFSEVTQYFVEGLRLVFADAQVELMDSQTYSVIKKRC